MFVNAHVIDAPAARGRHDQDVHARQPNWEGIASGRSFNHPTNHSNASTSRGPGRLKNWFPSTTATAAYTPDGHLLVGTKHWRTSSVQSRIQRMQSDFTVLQVDTIPNPDNVTNMSVTHVWPTNGDAQPCNLVTLQPCNQTKPNQTTTHSSCASS